MDNRGRKKENTEVIKVRTQEITDSVGGKMIYKFDYDKSPNGAYSVEFIPTKHQTTKPVFDLNQRTYSKAPTVMVFKSSERSNAKVKMKIFNKNVDYINMAKKLPGVPNDAVILELGVGESFITMWKNQYNLN
tara:strand:+ start:17 stop:415 length:399 start_codon:yes stop_codon:yes gene_type:complete